MSALEHGSDAEWSGLAAPPSIRRRAPPESRAPYTRGVWLADLILVGAVLVGAMVLTHVFDKKGSDLTAPGEEAAMERMDE
jgi:hypothetical protein